MIIYVPFIRNILLSVYLIKDYNKIEACPLDHMYTSTFYVTCS